MRTAQPIEQKFWRKVDKAGPDECWLWRGDRLKGYGLLSHKGKNRRAHRVSWELANQQEIPAGLHACHSCDNPSCVNPSHIWLGTQQDNMADMYAKGRRYSRPRKPRCPRPARGMFCILYCTKCGHYRSDDYLWPKGQRRCRPCELRRVSAKDANGRGYLRKKRARAAKRERISSA